MALPDLITLNQNYEFNRAYKRGKVKTDPALVTYIVKNRAGLCRIGITASKKLGNAVQRNRCRRIIRAAFLSLAPLCAPGYDIVFVARFKTQNLKSTDISRIMLRQLKELGVIS